MAGQRKTFAELCRAGETTFDDIDCFIERWHGGEGDPDATLGEFLGFTDAEYERWESGVMTEYPEGDSES